MQAAILECPDDVSYLDLVLLDEQSRLKAVPATVLQNAPPLHLIVWANRRGAYTLPTIELIDWLREMIAGRSAIEICAGEGAIGRALGIPATDSYMQTRPEIIRYYQSLRQTPITPPPDVQRFEAMEAVAHFKPQVVIGSYVTQVTKPGDSLEMYAHTSDYGVDELALIDAVEAYINIGNKSTHAHKRSRARPHHVAAFPWHYTRSMQPADNEILIFGK